MAKPSELRMLTVICQKATDAKTIQNEDMQKLTEAFGQRFTKAWKAVEGKRVKKYIFKPSSRVVWIVVGKNRDYWIMPAADFCTCDDFYFRGLDRHIHLCYHLIAQKLAETLKIYDLYNEDDELWEALMKEWKKAIL